MICYIYFMGNETFHLNGLHKNGSSNFPATVWNLKPYDAISEIEYQMKEIHVQSKSIQMGPVNRTRSTYHYGSCPRACPSFTLRATRNRNAIVFIANHVDSTRSICTWKIKGLRQWVRRSQLVHTHAYWAPFRVPSLRFIWGGTKCGTLPQKVYACPQPTSPRTQTIRQTWYEC